MRRTLSVATLALLASAAPFAQTTAPARGAKPATTKPITIAVHVTDPAGAPLADTTVTATGTVAREVLTAGDGSVQLMNMRPGTYRLRFAREGSITLEREITVRAGESPIIDVSLSPAPPPPTAPEPEPAASKTLPPPGDPRITPVPLFLEKNFIGGREARKESPLGCGAVTTATLHQLRDSWLAHAHEDADESIYVVAGEGTVRIGSTEQKIQAGTFSFIPHTVSHALIPQGRNPLIVISVLAGPPCAGPSTKG